jgi:hypothetical protein
VRLFRRQVIWCGSIVSWPLVLMNLRQIVSGVGLRLSQ